MTQEQQNKNTQSTLLELQSTIREITAKAFDKSEESYLKQSQKNEFTKEAKYSMQNECFLTTSPKWSNFITALLSFHAWESQKLSSNRKCIEFAEKMLSPFVEMYSTCIHKTIDKICSDTATSQRLRNDMCSQLNNELTAVFQKSLIERIQYYRKNLKPIIKPSLISVGIYLNQFLEGQDGWFKYFQETPVLLKLCGLITLNKTKNDLKILARLIKDKNELNAVLSVSLPIQVRNIYTNLSDPHRGRQSVAIIEFSDKKKVVYKPRSLSCDEVYTRVTRIIDKKNELKNPLLINKKNYGWNEFIEREEPCNAIEVQKYYNNLGKIFALIDFIGGVDFHEENFIIHGTSPVPIDLEGVFSPIEIPQDIDKLKAPDEFRVHQLDATCILPRYQYFDQSKRIVPLGPLVLEDRIFKVKRLNPKILNENSIAASLAEFEENKQSKQHIIHLDGVSIDPCEFKESFIEGFEKSYEYLIEKKHEIKNIIEKYHEKSLFVRRLFRPTLDYALIIRDCTSYDHLKSASKLEAWLKDQLTDGIDQMNDVDKLSIIESEVKQMINMDIPAFYQDVFNGRFSDNSLKLSIQNSVYPYTQFLGISMKKSHLYVKYASKYIKKSIAIYQSNKNINNRLVQSKTAFTNRSLRKNIEILAIELLEYLKVNANTDDISRPIYSLNLTNISGSTGISMVANSPFYLEGLSGIIIFAKTAIIAGLPVDINWLNKLTDNYYETISLFLQSKLIDLSGLYGVTGAIYPLLYRHNELKSYNKHVSMTALKNLKHGHDLASIINYEGIDRTSDDFLTGTCSNLILFSLLNRLSPNKLFAMNAETDYNRLLKAIRHTQDGQQFFDLKQNNDPMAGLAHGQSGAAIALSEYSKNLGLNSSELSNINIALNFERDLIKHETNSWPNFSDITRTYNLMGWCNGPAGIGLARLLLLQNHGYDNNTFEDVRYAIKCVINTTNKLDSFCCGNASVLLFLSKASKVEILNDEFNLKERVEDSANQLILNFITNGELELNIGKSSFASSGLLGGITGVILSLLNIIDNKNQIDPFLLG